MDDKDTHFNEQCNVKSKILCLHLLLQIFNMRFIPLFTPINNQ